MPDEIFIISTNEFNAPESTRQLLKSCKTIGQCDAFGNNFFPVVGISPLGEVHYLDDELEEYPEAQIWVIPDDFELRKEFERYVVGMLEQLDALHILLHHGVAAKHREHEQHFCKIAGRHLAKLQIGKDHHTEGNPLGDGLELVAAAVINDPVDMNGIEQGLSYLRNKPAYFSPKNEAWMYMFKSLQLLSMLKENGGIRNQREFQKRIADIRNNFWMEAALDLQKQLDRFKDVDSFQLVFDEMYDEFLSSN